MRRLNLSRRERRTIGVALALAAIVLIPMRAIPAWTSWRATAITDARELAHEVERLSAAVATLPTMADSLVARRERLLALAPRLLPGRGTAGAGSSLATRLTAAAGASSVRLSTVQLRFDTTSSEAFAIVAARAEGVGDIRGIARLLASLQGGAELLVLRDLTITQPDPGAPRDRAEALRFDLVVEGLSVLARTAPAASEEAR